MKKRLLSLFLVMLLTVAMLLSVIACEKTDSEKRTLLTDTDTLTSNDNNVSSSEGDSEPIPVRYLSIANWQDDLYWGVNDEGTTIVTDAEGNKLFELPDHRSIEGTFIGDYALITDNGVVDKKGNIVFELSESDFDEIYFSKCMDVGYILCSKDVNTFEETGTHYFAVNLEDGTTRRFEGELIPDEIRFYTNDERQKGWIYFGNGYLLHTPYAGTGVTAKQEMYNFITDEWVQGYRYDEEGNKIDRMYSLFFESNIHKKNNTVYVGAGDAYYGANRFIYKYDLETNYQEIIWGYDKSGVLAGDLSNSYVVDGGYDCYEHIRGTLFWVHKYLGKQGYIIDVSTNEVTPMTDYASFKCYKQLEDGSYLVEVTNDGGGKFITVVDKDGNRKFEPIIGSYFTCNKNCFILRSDETNTVYSYSGDKIATFSAAASSAFAGDRTVLYCENKTIILMNTETGEKTVLEQELTSSINDCKGYSDNGYVISNGKSFLLREDGSIIYFNAE